MSLHLPTRRLVSSAPSTLQTIARPTPRPVLLPLRPATQVRNAWNLSSLFGRRKAGGDNLSDTRASGGQNFDDPEVRKRFAEQQQPQLSSSIFEEEVDEAVSAEGTKKGAAQSAQSPIKTYESTAYRLDPDPRARLRWERKKVIQMVRRNGRVSRAERINQTEKEVLHKSPFLETSVKKLVHLARQIQGKTLEDALQQMTYSKKKMASEVKYQLEEARDLAIVTRGMGLGKAGGKAQDSNTKPVKIQTKDGKSLTIDDPTRIYVAQAWVGRGPWRFKEIDYKGRGRFGVMQSPSTSITVILKEEKTRLREHDEKQAKEARRKPWVHLPDRPVTAQRPYYSW